MRQNSPSLPSGTPTPTTTPAHGRTSSTANARCTEIVFPGKVPGNNGAGGLLRMHWRTRHKLLQRYVWVVKSQLCHRHAHRVHAELIRYSTGRAMDADNLRSTGKLLFDALVRAGVLSDDTPAIIGEPVCRQERAASGADQRTVIRIIDLPAITGTQPQ